MIDNYLDQTIALINESKLSCERKSKLLTNLKIMFESNLKRGIHLYIDKRGFEHFKQKIQAEETELVK